MTSILLRTGGSLIGSPALIAGKTMRPVRWAPPTLLGVNVTLPFSWRDPVHPTQKGVFDPVGISYVRPGMDYLYVNFSTTSATHDQAQFYVTSIRPYAADRTQIEMTVNALSYEPRAEQVMILADPITYNFANNTSLTLPAKTPLPCTGGTAGVFTSRPPGGFPVPITYGTVRFNAGSLLPDNGAQAVNNVKILHRNFYKQGSEIRRPLPMYLDRMAEWLNQGFYFDHGAANPAWEEFERDFGRDAALYMRRQDWAYFASLNLDPDKVLISDGPEPLDLVGSATAQQIWEACRDNLGQSYRDIRTYFPDHTVSLGIPNFTAINAAEWMGPNSWPGDSNSTLRLHCYPRNLTPPPLGASFPLDCDDEAELADYLDWFLALATRAGLGSDTDYPRVYFQEMGIQMEQPDAQVRYGNYRRALNARNIYQCLWAASYYFSTPMTYDVAHKAPGQSSGPFIPVPGLTGAFDNGV